MLDSCSYRPGIIDCMNNLVLITNGISQQVIMAASQLLLLLLIALPAACVKLNSFTACYHASFVDHGQFIQPRATFQQKYYVYGNSCNLSETRRSVIVYTGNEGPIEGFIVNSGFLEVLAHDLDADLVFIEHRYYGTSQIEQGAYYQYLSSSQALADFSAIIAQLAAPSKYVITTGGSYGGMLATWMRLSYPGLVKAAYASSAPLQGSSLQQYTTKPALRTGLYDVVASAMPAECQQASKAAFENASLALTDASNLALAAKLFGLCNHSKPTLLIAAIQASIVSMATSNYPYPTNFSMPLPAHPINASCSKLVQASSLSSLHQLRAFVDLAWTMPNNDCINLGVSPVAYLPGFIHGAWTYERCSEVVIPTAVGDGNPAFMSCSQRAANCYTTAVVNDYCNYFLQTKQQPASVDSHYGTYTQQLSALSHVVFTNGHLDPWSFGGVPANTTATLTPSYWMHGAAHHLDLRAPSPMDPADVVHARQAVTNALEQWIAEFFAEDR
eukprot:TRINITY_DN12479_c1_g1_i1.p2 TRINITY_DN12479_c1_g1~~TRINITY_DN12479_c1_g1_i1.p2  ORF type:complete len:501 (+),score=89.07 TRINITY_DN12479_c1_g1_i1:4202-5704(+)